MSQTFKKFDVVKLQEGVFDQETNQSLEGWQGRIIDFYDDENNERLAYIRWDSQTLQQLPEEFINLCFKRQIPWADVLIGVDSLDYGTEGDTLDQAEWQRQEMFARYVWPDLGKTGQKIKEIYDSFSKDRGTILQEWEKYLAEHLHFPFQTRIRKRIKNENLEGPKNFAVELNGADELYGVMVMLENKNRKIVLPIIDLVVSPDSRNYKFLGVYNLWFKNH